MQSGTMRTDRINELLERYYNAQTTEAEEKELKRFFTEEEVPAHLLPEKEMFLQLQATAGDATIPEGLEERLSQAIDTWATHEQRTLKIQRGTRIRHLQWIGSIAASILIVISFGWYLYEPTLVRKDTCATPEEAYMEAQKALAHFSIALNKGIEQMGALQETTERVEKSIQKQLNKINE